MQLERDEPRLAAAAQRLPHTRVLQQRAESFQGAWEHPWDSSEPCRALQLHIHCIPSALNKASFPQMLPPELRLGLNTVIVLPLLIKVMVPALTVGNPPVTQGLLKPEQGQHGTLRYSHAAGARGLQTQILLHWALHTLPRAARCVLPTNHSFHLALPWSNFLLHQ